MGRLHKRLLNVCFCPHLHRYWEVGVTGQSLSGRTEAGVGEHVLGGVVQDVGRRRGTGSHLQSWLLLEETKDLK